MNNRLKEIDEIINSIKNEDSYLKELYEKSNLFKKKFKNELEDYELITDLDSLYKLKSGGYIRYVNMKEEIRYGGILLKVFESENKDDFYKKNLIILQNSDNKKWTISWEKNYIYYKKQTKKGDNLRNLFISIIDDENKKF